MANVNSRKYWLRVRREAFTRAWRLIVGSTVTLFFAAVSVGSLVIGLSVFGSPDAALDEVVGRSVLAFAGFLFFLGVYLYFEHKIPAEWDSEKQDQIDKKDRQISDATVALEKKAVERVVFLTLSILWERGYRLNIERITLDQFPAWLQRVESWRFLTLKYIADKFSHQHAVSFGNTHYLLTENFIFNVSQDHNREMQQLSAQIDKIKVILQQNQDAWSTISALERNQINAHLVIFEAQARAADSR